MIVLGSHNPITQEEVDAINKDIYSIIKPEWKAFTSFRGLEYPFTVKYGNFNKDDITLDIGCATSWVFIWLANRVKLSYGIDWIASGGFDSFTIDWLKTLTEFQEYLTGKAIFLNGNASELPFKDNYFSKIYTHSALEHFVGNDDTLCAMEVGRCLQQGGVFLGTVDFNPVTEFPVKDNPECRMYTYDSFIERILIPSGLALFGEDQVKDMPIPKSVDYIATVLFFCLRKV